MEMELGHSRTITTISVALAISALAGTATALFVNPPAAEAKALPTRAHISRVVMNQETRVLTVKAKKTPRAKGYQYKFWGKGYYSYTRKTEKRKLSIFVGGEGTIKVKVRAYRGKRYGKWSKTKRVRVLSYSELIARQQEKFEREQEEMRRLEAERQEASEAWLRRGQYQRNLHNAYSGLPHGSDRGY